MADHDFLKAMFNLRYLRLILFQRGVALLQPAARGARMARFEQLLAPSPGTRVIDLGGTSRIWNLVRIPLDITILNLPRTEHQQSATNHHRFTFVEGDATEVKDYADNSFDIAFSNSVIEHVGDEAKQQKFANEVRRLARSYFVQTPSIYFPIEPHSGIPFWWIIPRFIRARMHKRWKKTLPAWNDMVANTTVISRRRLQDYFFDGAIGTEKLLGIPKSYYAYRVNSLGTLDPSTRAPSNNIVL